MKNSENRYDKRTVKIALAVLACAMLFADVLLSVKTGEVGWRFFLFVLVCAFSFEFIGSMRKQKISNAAIRRASISRIFKRRERQEEEKLEAAKAQFILSTQHHLRGPLTVVQGYLSLVLDGAYGRINERARTKIKASLEETQKMIKIVDEFFDVVTRQMDNSPLEKTEIDVPGMLKEITTDLLAYARASDLALELEEGENPIPRIMGDYPALKETFYNIIDNAIKYTKEGGVKIKISFENGDVGISVKDTGVGMSDQEIKDIFEKTFTRGKEAWKTNTSGKGIGLYLAAQTVIGHGGKIWVESQGRGKGSTFYVRLPVGASQ